MDDQPRKYTFPTYKKNQQNQNKNSLQHKNYKQENPEIVINTIQDPSFNDQLQQKLSNYCNSYNLTLTDQEFTSQNMQSVSPLTLLSPQSQNNQQTLFQQPQTQFQQTQENSGSLAPNIYITMDFFQSVIQSIENRMSKMEERIELTHKMQKIQQQEDNYQQSDISTTQNLSVKSKFPSQKSSLLKNKQNSASNLTQSINNLQKQTNNKEIQLVLKNIQSHLEKQAEKSSTIQDLQQKIDRFEKFEKKANNQQQNFEKEVEKSCLQFSKKLSAQFEKFFHLSKQKFDEFQYYKEQSISQYLDQSNDSIQTIKQQYIIMKEELEKIQDTLDLNSTETKVTLQKNYDQTKECENSISGFKTTLKNMDEDLLTLIEKNKNNEMNILELQEFQSETQQNQQSYEQYIQHLQNYNNSIAEMQSHLSLSIQKFDKQSNQKDNSNMHQSNQFNPTEFQFSDSKENPGKPSKKKQKSSKNRYNSESDSENLNNNQHTNDDSPLNNNLYEESDN